MRDICTAVPVVDLPPAARLALAPIDAFCEEWRLPETLAQVLQAVPTAIYTTDARGRITFYNAAAIKLWGCSPELGRSEFCGSWRLFWPDGRSLPHDQCPMAVALRTGEPNTAEGIAERCDGSRVVFIAYATPLRNTSGEVIGAVNTLVDITERKREEVLGDCQRLTLHMLAQGAPLKDLLEHVIEVMERHAHVPVLGSILILDESRNRFERGIGKSLPDGFNAAMECVAANSSIGFCHTAQHCETIVVSDFESDPAWAAFAKFLRPFGIRAGWSTPILGSGGEVLGTFANYYRKPCHPTPQDLEWVDMIKRIAVLAIERKRVEQAKQQLVSIVESAEDAIVSKNLDGIIITWNPAAERMFGYKKEEIVGRPITVLIPAGQRDEEPEILRRVKNGERIEHYETTRQRKDGSLIEISLTVSPIRNTEGAVVGASKIVRDITERRQSQLQQALLLREMSHRVKNLFTVVSSLVTLCARSARTPMEMAHALRGRLAALAIAHGLTRGGLIEQGCQDSQAATLDSLIRTIFSPYVNGRECLAICCPDVSVGPNAVTGVAMVLHEFATNAVKYGALSRPEGFVSIDGAVANGMLALKWEERDGPRLSRSPDHQGFGGMLASRIIEGQFEGQLAYDWTPNGLVISLSIPMTRLVK
jgi:PAS domain S-box-containing protein